TMTCQRCMQAVKVDVADSFQLVLVADEDERIAQADRQTGYEPIVAEPTRLNLAWVTEEQILLSVPLVAKHADEDCGSDVQPGEQAPPEQGGASQRPFADLKRLLRNRS